MFENIRIEANNHAPEEYIQTGSAYFLDNELQKLYATTKHLPRTFAPDSLQYAVLLNSKSSVEERFQQAGLDGKYYRDAQPTIHLLHDNLNGYARAVFWHEYGHHVWFSLNVKFQQEWKEIERLLPSNISYQKAEALDEFAEERYLTLPEEVWARLFCQYFLVRTDDHEAWERLAGFPEIFWTRDDIRQCAGYIENLLLRLQFTVNVQD
jgi:hypothetical protein